QWRGPHGPAVLRSRRGPGARRGIPRAHHRALNAGHPSMSGSRLHAVPRVPEPPQGDAALVAVDRVLAELRRGRAVAVQDAATRTWRLVVALETASAALVSHVLGQPGAALAVTGARAAA